MTLRGSESSRTLQRRLQVSADGKGFSHCSVEQAKSLHALDELQRQQIMRFARVLDRSVRRVEKARRRHHDELATKKETIVEFVVEVRGSCGSDVHLGSGES